MSTIDEKFSKLIAENTAVEEEVVEEEASPLAMLPSRKALFLLKSPI